MGLFYLVRHGESAWNAENRLCGRSEVPLSETGRSQAKNLSKRLRLIPFEAFYTSPLGRAFETARLIAEAVGLEPVPDHRLVELDYGQWEGRTLSDIMQNDAPAFRAWDAKPAQLATPGGETGLAAQQRIVSFLDFLASRHQQDRVLVTFHKTVCRLAICHILGMAPDEYRRRLVLSNAALSIIRSQPNGWQLVSFNDTSHLSAHLLESNSLGEGL